MNVKVTYPLAAKRRFQRRKLLSIARWPLLLAAIICPVINYVTGGKAWSIIVLMSLYMVWTLVLSPALVEYNRISQFIKLIICSSILLTLIDRFLAPGWAIEVVPIVCFSGLIICGVLFFTDLERQKQNMLPMLLFIFYTLAGSVIGLSLWHGESRWALAVMGIVSAVLLIACIVILGGEFPRELKRRFHIK